MQERRPLGKKEDFATTLVRIILQSMTPENGPQLISRIVDEQAPDVQVQIYAFVKDIICAWAGMELSISEQAAVIEDCRKICDVMGWPPTCV